MKQTSTNFLLKILAGCLFITAGLTQRATAQNIAPLATTNGQGSGTVTPYLWNWNRINDLSYSTCGSQEAFIWTDNAGPNGTEWMEWAWSTAYPINKIVIEHGQTTGRFLTGGTIQYWDGSTWVNHYTFSGLNQSNCTNTVTFPVLVSTKLRIANWKSGTGQVSNMNYREIEIWQGATPGTHARTAATYNKGLNCGSTSDSMVVEVQNIGTVAISNFYVGSKVTGTINGSGVNLNDSVLYTGSLSTGQTATVKLYNFNSINGANINVKSWVNVAADTGKKDDTLSMNLIVLGSPTTDPSPSNADRCGSGSITLNGGAAIGTSVFWYDQSSAGKLLGVGNTFNTPNINAPNTVSYYAASAKLSADSSLTTGFGGSNYAGAGFWGGNMFEVTVVKTVLIDSIAVHLYLSNTQSVSVYMKQGTYTGFQTTPGAWTLVQKSDVKSRNLGNPSNMKLNNPLLLEPGTYAFYVFANENLVFHAQPPAIKTIGNTAMVTNHGIALRDSFNTVFGGSFNWNGTFYYHEACVRNSRVAVNATAKALPVGAALSKGNPFKGTYDAGLVSQPDIVANPDGITYQIDAPTGYVNSGYGSTWTITSITATSAGGITIPSGDINISNPGSSPGKIVYSPSSSYTDSMVRIRMTVKSLTNNCDSLIERWIYVAPRPKGEFVNTAPCDGDPVVFTNKSNILKGTLTYNWDFGDGNTSDLSDPEHLYATSGSYNVQMVVTSNYGYTDTFRQTITVSKNPVADFDANNACEGTPVKLTDASTLPPGTTTYQWIMGDGSPDQTTSTASRQYATPGIYQVTLIVSVNGCFDQVSKYVTQAPRGNVSFNANLGECDNADINFTNTSSAPEFGSVSYLWSFGDGGEQTSFDASHSYGAFQTFKATLYAHTDMGCLDSAQQMISLRESPKASFTTSGSVCTGEDINFNNTTNVPAGSTNTYSWDFGDAFNSSATSPDHRYFAAGDYTVKLKVLSTNGCDGEGEMQITVGQKPAADFVVNKVCQGGVTEFTNNSVIPTGTLTYSWDLGNSTTSTSVNPTVTYAAAGSYNVILITTSSAGCMDTATGTAFVAAIPSVDIIPQSAGTGEGTMKFTTSSTGVTYKWLFGDGGSSELQSPTYKYLVAGTWKVSLKVTSPDGCTNSTSTEVSVNPLSIASATGAKLAVYPNPGSGIYHLLYSGNAPLSTITVTDMLGKVVAEFSPGSNGETVIDLTSKSAGVYLITIIDNEGKLTAEKITLEK